MKRTVVLVILDGWGLGQKDESNPVHVVRPDVFERLGEEYPVTSLQASGISVGLPWGEVGNSEVGHLTIGAGKVLYQHYPRITIGIRDGSFFNNEALKNSFVHARNQGTKVNFVGLLSKGNVHASVDHVRALIQFAEKEAVPYALHLFADGKDNPPFTLEELLEEFKNKNLASLIGRHYAMDRDGKWQLTQKAYDALTGSGGIEISLQDISLIIEEHYKHGMNEEFLPPFRIQGAPRAKDGDAFIFFNYREDSIRQIVESFVVSSFDKFPATPLSNSYVATFTQYEKRFPVAVAFPPETISSPLGKVLSDNGKTQLRVAETYKYAHVTFFFNGYREEPYKNEYRVLIPSLSVPRVEEHPEMRASLITDRVLSAIQDESFDFILVNYANPDTIGHTGNYDAGLEAVRVINTEIGRLLAALENKETALLIASDHGNIEEMVNPMTAQPETQHDPSPIPFYLVAREFKGRRFTNQNNLGETAGILSDIAPTVLELLGIPAPDEMTGESLLKQLEL